MSISIPYFGFYKWALLFVVIGAAAFAWWHYNAKATVSPKLPPAVATAPGSSTDLASSAKSAGALLPLGTTWSALPGIKSQASAANFAQALKAYNPEDQQYLKNYNSLSFGLLDFSSPEDQQWKLARGYPTIEEVLANRTKPLPNETKFYHDAPLKEVVMVALRIGVAIQEAKNSKSVGAEIPDQASQLVFGVAGRIGEENPLSASLAGYLYALSESPYQPSGSVSHLFQGASLSAQMGDPVLARNLSQDSAIFEHLKNRGVPGELYAIYGNGVSVRRWQTQAGIYTGRPFDLK